MDPKMNIYAIYTLEDKEAMRELLHHLRPLEEDNGVSIWDGDAILSGQAWKPKNDAHLDLADVFLLLVSDAFMHSEFIQQLEFKRVIDRYKSGKATVIPILLNDCPWTIDFNSDDYNFNFKELQVLPQDGTPIKNWDSPDQAYKQIAGHIKQLVNPTTLNPTQEAFQITQDENASNNKIKDQIAIDFTVEEAKARRRIEEEKKISKEIDAAANREAADAKRQKEVAEAKSRAEAQKLKQDTEAKRKAEEELKLKRETETKIRAEEAIRIEAAAMEAKRRTEKAKRQKDELEATKRAAEKQSLAEVAETMSNTTAANTVWEERNDRREKEKGPWAKDTAETDQENQELLQEVSRHRRKRIRIVALVAAIAIIVMWAFSLLTNKDVEKETLPTITDSVRDEKPETDSEPKEEIVSILNIGDTYEGGIVFAIDPSGKTGKIAHLEDSGPMSWSDAMKIDGELGEGWRLPTFDELQIMYRNIGQGATNSGEFADELYWSATPYDEYQARLLRFRDGNTSYHYNKAVEQRKFLIRAIRDFGQ